MIIKKAIVEKANRLHQLSPDIFAFTREKTRPARLKKVDLVDLARFNWPAAMETQGEVNERWHRPASKEKLGQLRGVLAEWCASQFGAKLNPTKEIFIGGRISSLIFATALGFIDNGDIVFVPELGLPLYRRVTTACGGEAVHYSVSVKNDWRPNFERINTRLGRVARLLFLNSPHNPTGVCLSDKEMEDLVWMASRENIVIVNDAAYYSTSTRSPASLLAVAGGKKVGVEVYSFSYLFGLPALPFGFVVGNRDVISGLELASNLMPTFIPEIYVDFAVRAIRQYPGPELQKVRTQLQRSTAEATKLLEMLALQKSGYDTIPFIWAEISGRRHARTLASILYRRSRVLVAPGTSFGDSGEGFLRFSLTADAKTYQTACERLKKKVDLLKEAES